MTRPRIIPVLLLKDEGLVKTILFNKKKAKYIGDPINAVRLFNDLKADELVFLDIMANKKKSSINLDLVKKIGDEAFMPFAVGGGIKSIDQVDKILKYGAEKVVINTSIHENFNFIKEVVAKYGSQSIVACIDVKDGFFNKNNVYKNSGINKVKIKLDKLLDKINALQVGEIIIQSINNDGLMKGYNLELISYVSKKAFAPVIALGGCGQIEHMKEAINIGKANAAAAGSFFVYHGSRNAVLINYPTKEEIYKNFNL